MNIAPQTYATLTAGSVVYINNRKRPFTVETMDASGTLANLRGARGGRCGLDLSNNGLVYFNRGVRSEEVETLRVA